MKFGHAPQCGSRSDLIKSVTILTYTYKKKRYDRDIVPNVRMAVVDRRVGLIVVAGERSGGARSDDAFAAAGEKVGIADFSEGISVVDVD